MTTAADALVRDCANRLDKLFRQDYTMREVEAELRRLLRATQSNGHSPDTVRSAQPSGEQACEGARASGESPAQSAPAHDALAGQTNNGRPKQPRSISEGREVEAWKYYLDGCWHVCLDEDSDEHIRENGIALSTHEYRWEWK